MVGGFYHPGTQSVHLRNIMNGMWKMPLDFFEKISQLENDEKANRILKITESYADLQKKIFERRSCNESIDIIENHDSGDEDRS